ncbi:MULTISPECIES: hypothetical protein [unclassified Clostridium]|uniref:hypothetical protein n=1 Tax=unclassified Clostridium TaxID=2614128 RepID=UPI000297E4D4|nr:MULTISPECIES: hypothetical protein [unclassified Clostridium]EKQ52397.1 MAG: hypothetical protein A370_04230 [Clostridium sp. Maddingley MBC34-26]
MNIRKQKREEEEELNRKRERKVYNRLCLIGSFMLLLGSFFGTARGMKQSVFTILINNPLKGLPYVVIIVTITAIFYVIVRFFSFPKGK